MRHYDLELVDVLRFHFFSFYHLFCLLDPDGTDVFVDKTNK